MQRAIIIQDHPRYDAEIEQVLDAAFGPGRFSKVSERVREFAELNRSLSHVAIIDNKVVGCCRIYRINVGDTPALFLGPLAVAPQLQGSGRGRGLVSGCLKECETVGVGAVIVVGQPWMFAPFGFTEIPRDRIVMPGPIENRRLQWRALIPGGIDTISGVVKAPLYAS